MRKENLHAIINEPQLSEKLHKISRAIRSYEIPEYILKILHDGERKLEEFENELARFKQVSSKHIFPSSASNIGGMKIMGIYYQLVSL